MNTQPQDLHIGIWMKDNRESDCMNTQKLILFTEELKKLITRHGVAVELEGSIRDIDSNPKQVDADLYIQWNGSVDNPVKVTLKLDLTVV